MATGWTAYEYQPSFVLGFHGCDARVGEGILSGKTPHLLPSEKKYDWLGQGIYFWEGNPSRALAWARQRKSEGKIKKPFVLGAIIDLRHCLDLFDHDAIAMVQKAHTELVQDFARSGLPLPENRGNTPDMAACWTVPCSTRCISTARTGMNRSTTRYAHRFWKARPRIRLPVSAAKTTSSFASATLNASRDISGR